MQNYDEQSQVYDYRGKRGLVLLRVSTEEQEKKYGFPSQLRSIREKLIEPYQFERLYGAWFEREVRQEAHNAVLRFAERYIRALERVHQ